MMASNQESLRKIAINFGAEDEGLKSEQEYLAAIAANTENIGEAGDMSTDTYDPDGDGKVESADTADSVPWSGVTNPPAITSAQPAAAVEDTSGGGDISEVESKVNELLAALRTAGLMN